MLPQVRTAALARLAAALVAVTLSGAPRVLAMHVPVDVHRCSCRAHGGEHHECECAICRKAALTAQATDEKSPRCHRTAARRALSERAPTGSRGSCIEGTCGGTGQPTMTPAGVEPFCMPAPRAVAIVERTEVRVGVADPIRDRPIEPAKPRPKAA